MSIFGEMVDYHHDHRFFPTLGSPTIKSIVMSTHMCVGIGSGCNSPGVFTISPLFLW
jgi:hypothetical protein